MSNQSNSSFRVVVLISGRGSNLEALVRSIKVWKEPIKIVAVVSDKSSAGGLEFARSEGVPTVVVPRLSKERSSQEFNTALADAVESFAPDLIVLAGFMRVVLPEFISRFPNKIINIHPALLPSFRGLHGQAQALAAGVKFAGCTVHYVTPEVDAGPIIAQAVVPVMPEDTEETLSARILKKEHQLLPMVVRAIARGGVSLVQQNGQDRVRTASDLLNVDDSMFLISLC
jgi:phosphoribosylglycinamide formyltransferase 1